MRLRRSRKATEVRSRSPRDMNDANDKTWHRETITAATEETLLLLRDASILSGCYLAGGTALALHFGHRTSEDLDFFTEDLFNEQVLLQRLQQIPCA
jgi:hypothetical protein